MISMLDARGRRFCFCDYKLCTQWAGTSCSRFAPDHPAVLPMSNYTIKPFPSNQVAALKVLYLPPTCMILGRYMGKSMAILKKSKFV